MKHPFQLRGYLSTFNNILELSVLICFLPILAFGIPESGQQSGSPYIRNFFSEEYRANQQNWGIAQDRQGIMHFANGEGVLAFDGTQWRLTKLLGVRSLAIDSTGIIYAGLENDFGNLTIDIAGNYTYHSFRDLVPKEFQDINAVRRIYVSGKTVLFCTYENLFLYRDGKVNVISPVTKFSALYRINDRYYIQDVGKGLFMLENDRLMLVDSSEQFVDDPIRLMLPYGKDEALIITAKRGAFIFSPAGGIKFRKPDSFREADRFLLKHWVYSGTRLENGDFAVGTVTDGFVVIDPLGRIKSHFNKQNGLIDNAVYSIFEDRNRELWLGTDIGISLISFNSPFRSFTGINGLDGASMCLLNYRDRVYAGTNQNLYMLRKDGFFTPVSPKLTSGQNFQLYEAQGRLLLAHNPGLFEIKDDKALAIPNTEGITYLSITKVVNNPNYLFAGGGSGLYILEFKNSTWRLKNHLKGCQLPAYTVAQDKQGNLWFSDNSVLYRMQLNNSLDSVVSKSRCTSENGLPTNFLNLPVLLDSGEVVFCTENGVYRYREDQGKFEPHPSFSMLKGNITVLCPLPGGDIWAEATLPDGTFERILLQYTGGKYVPVKTPFYKLDQIRGTGSTYTTCRTSDSLLYIGVASGIMQYDPRNKSNPDHSFHTLIRRVTASDSLLFGGATATNEDSVDPDARLIPYSKHDLTFHFASVFYENFEKNRFSFRLLGADTAWSAWSADQKKEYTNLPEGSYAFEVRSMNQYHEIGTTASYPFRILPPWYRTWWAYSLYFLFGGVAIFLLVHLRTRQLRLQRRVLEKIVEERTAQIREQKDNVEQLSRIGRDITSSLSIENIIQTVYENVNNLMDASVFTIGLHNPDKNCLEFPATIEKNQLLQPFSVLLSDENRLAAWCFNHRQDVIINDYKKDYTKYVTAMSGPITGENPESVLYLPLWNKEKEIGVISAQSFSKNAYTDYHINMLRNLATYSAIALENADAYRQLAALLEDLKTTQDRLITQSKLAALGELTAGIAHEIQNPLNFVNNFSEINTELIEEMQLEIDKGNLADAKAISNDIKANEIKINHHGQRADSIVKGMLQHSRSSSGIKEPTDINALAEEFLRLSYHGLRAKDKSFNATLKTDFDSRIGKIDVVSQDIGRVVLNLITNAFYAVTEKKKLHIEGYEPLVTMTTKKADHSIEICVKDNGSGIPQAVLNKIFQPFFTTKPAGQGTGLGLSLAYDIIVKGHGGEIKVETKEGEGSAFRILLPSKN